MRSSPARPCNGNGVELSRGLEADDHHAWRDAEDSPPRSRGRGGARRRWARAARGSGGRQGAGGVCRGQPQERARRRQRRLEEESGKEATISYAASSALAKQIEHGAPAEVFISADPDWMDYLAQRGLISRRRASTPRQYAGPDRAEGSDAEATIAPCFPLAALIGDGRLAVANVDAVPAGKYAKAALTKLGVWEAVKDKPAQAENVRARAGAGVARRDAARHRLWDRRRIPIPR